MRTTLDLPEDVVELLRRESARRGGRKKASLSSLVSNAVREVYTGEAYIPALVDLKGGRVVVKRDEAILRLHQYNLWAPSAATHDSAVAAMRRAVADKPGFAIGWLRHARQFRDGNPQYFWSELEYAAALGALGRKRAASAALKRVEKLRTGFCKTPVRFLRCYIMQDDLVDAVMQGLKAAGLDAGSTGSKRLTAETR